MRYFVCFFKKRLKGIDSSQKKKILYLNVYDFFNFLVFNLEFVELFYNNYDFLRIVFVVS